MWLSWGDVCGARPGLARGQGGPGAMAWARPAQVVGQGEAGVRAWGAGSGRTEWGLLGGHLGAFRGTMC